MTEKKANLILGAVTCTIGQFFIAAMSACTKLMEGLSIPTILFFINAVGLLLVLPWIAKVGFVHLKTKRLGLHLTRDVGGLFSFFSLFLAIKTIPLAEGILLQNTAPLWLPIVIYTWLRVHIRKNLWWGMGLGFLGVIFILKPGEAALQTASFLGLLSGILFSITMVAVRRLTSTEPTYRILFYYALVSIIIVFPFVDFHWASFSLRTWLLLLGAGSCGFLGQVFVTYAFKHGKASTLAPLVYTTVLFAAIFGWLLWGYIPDLLSILGMLLVICGGILSIYFEKRDAKAIEHK